MCIRDRYRSSKKVILSFSFWFGLTISFWTVWWGLDWCPKMNRRDTTNKKEEQVRHDSSVCLIKRQQRKPIFRVSCFVLSFLEMMWSSTTNDGKFILRMMENLFISKKEKKSRRNIAFHPTNQTYFPGLWRLSLSPKGIRRFWLCEFLQNFHYGTLKNN